MRNPFAAKTDQQSETERGYREQMAQFCLDGATVPRARYILELDTAIMKDTRSVAAFSLLPPITSTRMRPRKKPNPDKNTPGIFGNQALWPRKCQTSSGECE